MSMICVLLFLLCYFTFQQDRQKVLIRSLERRWVALSVDSHLAHVPHIIGSCIVLHNSFARLMVITAQMSGWLWKVAIVPHQPLQQHHSYSKGYHRDELK